MGGKAYQSRGCANCRKRRVKCDLGKPECAQCITRGVPCPGYVEYRNFLHHSLVTRRTPSGNTTRPAHCLIDKFNYLPQPNALNGNVEVRTQIFSGFMDELFVHNTLSDCKDDSWYLFMSQVPSMAGESGLLDRSVIALATTFLANKRGDNQLIRHGVEIYNGAMSGLARMLQRGCQPNVEMFYSMILFHTYELMQTNVEAWQNCFTHIQGATAISKHLDYTNHEGRPFLRAMLNRQKWAMSFFALNPQYVSEVHCDGLLIEMEDSPLDQLFRIVAECATLQKSLDQIKEQKRLGFPVSCTALLSYCHKVEDKLQKDWLTEYAPRLDGGPICDGRFSESYGFPSIGTGRIYILYWVLLLAVRRICYHTENLLERAPSPRNMLLCADHLCRCVAYCMQPRNRVSAAQVVLFGISQASRCYIDCADRERFLWCQDVYSLVNTAGFTVVQRLKQEQCNYWDAVHGR